MMRTINEIIVHCTATTQGTHVTVADVDKLHRKRGFRCIGYHYLVYLDGSVHVGRSEEQIGAHCTGHNAKSIGVCYVGGLEKKTAKPKDTRTQEQRTALRELLKKLKAKYPHATIHGHREYANKACPCFDVREYKDL